MFGAAKPTVFIIDSDRAVRTSLGLLLECEGIVAHTYGSATAFLSEMQPQPNCCILVDVDLPGLNGLDILHELDQRDIVIPAIVTISRKVTDCFRSSVAEVGATLIEKPYNPRALIASLREVLDCG